MTHPQASSGGSLGMHSVGHLGGDQSSGVKPRRKSGIGKKLAVAGGIAAAGGLGLAAANAFSKHSGHSKEATTATTL